MLPQYASFRPQISAPTVTAIASGSSVITSSYTYRYFLQLQNRAGRNLLSNLTLLTVNVGEIVRWEVPTGIIESGEEIFYYVLSASPDNNPTNAVLLAKIKARDDDQTTIRTLPITLDLTNDEHFILSGTVADVASLPTSNDLIPGMIRFATAEAKYFVYDNEAFLDGDKIKSYGRTVQGVAANPTGYWIETNEAFSSEVTNTIFSADRLIRDGEASLPSPEKEVTTPTQPVRIWLLNGYEPDGQSDIFAGTQYSLQVRVAETDLSTFFVNKVELTNVGRITRSTGVLSTTNEGFGLTTIWDGTTSLITIESDLPRGQAEVYDLVLNFDNDELALVVPIEQPQILINIFQYSGTISGTSALVPAIGDAVLNSDFRLLVVTNKILPGVASMKPVYVPAPTLPQILAGFLAPDTPNQYVTISAPLNALPRVRATLGEITDDERIRAVVSTVPGLSVLAQSAGNIFVDGTQNIQVTVTHPFNATTGFGTVRDDYSDPLVQSIDQADFTETQARFYFDDGSTITESTLQAVTPTEMQIFIFTDFAGFSTIGSLPTPSNSQGLFKVEQIDLATIGAGTIAAGTYDVYVAYETVSPNNNITVVDHSSPPAIITQTNTISEVVNLGFKAKVSLNDQLAEFLIDKITPGTNIDITEINDGAIEQVRISSTPPYTSISSSSGASFIVNPLIAADTRFFISPAAASIDLVVLTAGATNTTYFEFINDDPQTGVLNIKIDSPSNPIELTLDANAPYINCAYDGSDYKFYV